MKKIALILGAVIVSTGLFAQKANVKKAENALYEEPVNYDKAIEYIELAKQNPETAEQSDTWFTAGRIGYDMAYKELNKFYLQQQPNYDAMGTGLDMMFTNYMVANQFDSYLDKKGRVKYENRRKMVADFKEMHDQYINAGVTAGDEQRDYEKAFTLLNEYLQISDSEMFGEKPIKVEDKYNEVKYYAAFYARRAGKDDEAIRLFEELKSVKNDNSVYVFQNLSEIYMMKGDTLKAEATLEESVAMFPTNADVIGSLVMHCMNTGKSEKAVENLDKLVNSDPSNIEYKIVKASVLTNNLKDFEAAKATLQPLFEDGTAANNTSILFEMGQVWMQEGNEYFKKADYTDDDKEYVKFKADFVRCFETALGYFNEAYSKTSKDDANYKYILQYIREIYSRLNKRNTDEYKAIDEEFKALGL